MRTLTTTKTKATSVATPAAATPKAAPATVRATSHLGNRTTANALFAAWSGDPITLIDSPPGAGKTTVITELAVQLADRAGLRVAIAGQTRVQTHDVTNRIAALGQIPALLGGRSEKRPTGLNKTVKFISAPSRLRTADANIVLATTARWLWTDPAVYAADILLVDEAYQITHADLLALGAIATQMVLVGDPGQIAPVVTADTSRWTGFDQAPDRPAPLALRAAYGDQITRLTLDTSWRLGPDTVTLVQPAFYPDLPFGSGRPTEAITLHGIPEPELTGMSITPASDTDPLISEAASDRVRELLTATLTTPTGQRPITATDIAVITPRVLQSSLIAARLADHPDLLIGTANAVQGAERPVAVVIHPLMGLTEATDFGTDPGRTCVALTRHRAHATIITDTTSTNLLRAARRDQPTNSLLATHQTLLETLT